MQIGCCIRPQNTVTLCTALYHVKNFETSKKSAGSNMEPKDLPSVNEKPCEIQPVTLGNSESNEAECCEFGVDWRSGLSNETTVVPEKHFSIFPTEDTISDQMLNFSLSGVTCEDKFVGEKVAFNESNYATADTPEGLVIEKCNTDESLLPLPNQNWSYIESFINENKDDFLDLCTTNEFSTNLIGEEDSDSFLFDDDSTLSSDVCSLKIRYESFQDNIREQTNFQEDAQLNFFPSIQCNGTKKVAKTPIKNNAVSPGFIPEGGKGCNGQERSKLYELETNQCLLSGVFLDNWKEGGQDSIDSVCLSSIIDEDQENWQLLRKNAQRCSKQTNYTLRAKRQIRYSDDYLYDIDSLETVKLSGTKDHITESTQEDDDDWCPRKRRKTGKKEAPVVIKYIIVNRFKGHKSMRVKISKLDSTEKQVLLTDEFVKKYQKLSPLKDFLPPVPYSCNVYPIQERDDGKLKPCSGAGMSYMFFASKNKNTPLGKANSQIGKDTFDRNSARSANGKSPVPHAEMHRNSGQCNAASPSPLPNFNTASLHSPAFHGKLEAHSGLLSPVPATSCPEWPVPSAYNTLTIPEISGGYFRSLLDGDDPSINTHLQLSSQHSSVNGQCNKIVTENPFSSPQQRQSDDRATRCNGGEPNICQHLEEKSQVQQMWSVETVQNLHLHGGMGKDLFHLWADDSENESLVQVEAEKRPTTNRNLNHHVFTSHSSQNEMNVNCSQKYLNEKTNQTLPSKDSLCILDISNFTPARVKQRSWSRFSQVNTPGVLSETNISLDQCRCDQVFNKVGPPSLCVNQWQTCGELNRNVKTYSFTSDPSCMSFSQSARPFHSQASDHINSTSNCKFNKAINFTRTKILNTNASQWDEKNDDASLEKEAVEVQGNTSGGSYAEQMNQSEKAYKPTKGFTNKDLEMCAKLVKKGLINTKSKLPINGENLNGKDDYWLVPTESCADLMGENHIGSRVLNGHQREFEEPDNILSNIVSGMAAVQRFMMASVEPMLNPGDVVLSAINPSAELKNSYKWKSKPLYALHIGAKDLKNKKSQHGSECIPSRDSPNNESVNRISSCCAQNVSNPVTQPN
uniref:DUF4683 domain-containing protein n=1 Tax=Callorhinchus milii TaxID=7868 RepID=A0A4W3H983_CALMI